MVCGTKWHLDELVEWNSNCLVDMPEDNFPFNILGECAAEKDNNARDFDSDDDEEFDKYYDTLEEWCNRHRWHKRSSSAILSDVYFERNKENIIISWNNTDNDDARFVSSFGYFSINYELFNNTIKEFVDTYHIYWSEHLINS